MDLNDLLVARNGVVTRHEAMRHVSGSAIDRAVRAHRLVIWLPSILVDSCMVEDPMTRLRAAVLYATRAGRNPAAISHSWALLLHKLIEDIAGQPIAVTTPADVKLTSTPSVVAHRCDDFAAVGTRVVRGLPVSSVEWACLSAWPELPVDRRRAAVICAVRSRQTTVDRLIEKLTRMPALKGRAELVVLCGMLRAGAQSEFEIWGLTHLFTPDLLRRSQGQLPIRVGGRTFYADRGFEEEKVAYELDGTRWHDTPEQRRIDARRDAALATVGYQTLRIGYHRAHAHPASAREELRTVLATRRRQLGLPPAA